MAASKDLITKIILKGKADSSLTKAFQSVSKQSESSLNKLQKYGQTAGKAMKVAATATATGLALAAKSAIDYESAFAGVKKTVDETDTTKYEDLSNGIRELAKVTPAAVTEIADVAAAAGQLGIKADDIIKFSKTMIDLGESTNLSSEEAATSIAKLFNVTGTSMDNVDRFGSTLVALGNNAATTEADIMNMASRIAGSGTQIGLTEQQVLALSTSLSSVGIEAESGGTAISTVMSQIDKDVAMNEDTLSTWASTAGLSVDKFKTMWQTDAYGAIQKVVAGMGDVKKGGGNLNLVLDELGIKGIRTSDTMKRLSNASGLMSDMTDLANKSWEENTALTKEAGTRYATMASKIQIAKNKINDVGITVGNALMPALDALMAKMDEINWDKVGESIASKVTWVIEHFDQLKVALGILASAFVGFKVASFINTVAGAAREVKILMDVMGTTAKITKFIGVLKGMPIVTKLAAAGQWLLNASFLGCPVIWIIGAIVALVAVFAILWKKCDGFRNFWIGLWDKIKSIASSVGDWLNNFFTVTIPNAFNAFVEKCKSVGNAIKDFFMVTIPNAFRVVVDFFVQLPSKIGTFLVNVITKIASWGVNLWAKAKEIGSNFINGIITFFSQLPYKIGYCIGFAIGKIITFGQKLQTFATTTIPQFISKIISWFAQLPSRIWTWLTNVVLKVLAWGALMIAIGVAKAKQFLTNVVNFFKQLPGRIWTWLTNTVQKVIAWGARIVSIGRQRAMQFINAVVGFIRTLPSRIWTWLVNAAMKVVAWGAQLAAKGRAAANRLKNAVVSGIRTIPSRMLSIGKDIVKGIWNGITGMAGWLKGKVKSFAKGIADGMANALKIGSPSRVMSALFKWVPVGAGKGIMDNAKYAVRAAKDMSGKVAKAASKTMPTITPKVKAIAGKVKSFATGGTVTTPQLAVVGDANETIVPHGNTPRNRGLLQQAAEGVGASTSRGNVFNITFAPTVNGGNAEENRAMLREEEAEFERKMDAYFAKKGRLAF